MEGEKPEQEAMGNLEKAVHQLGRDEPGLYVELHSILKEYGRVPERVQEVLAPAICA